MSASKMLPNIHPYRYPKNALGRQMSCFSAAVAVFGQTLGLLPLAFYFAGEAGLGAYLTEHGFEIRSSGQRDTAAKEEAGLCLSTIRLQSKQEAIAAAKAALDSDLGVIFPADVFYLPFSALGYQALHHEDDLAVCGYDSANALVVYSLTQFQGPMSQAALAEALDHNNDGSPEFSYRIYTLRFGPPSLPDAELARSMLRCISRRVLGQEPTPPPPRSGGKWVSGLAALEELRRALPHFVPSPDTEELETAMRRLAAVAEKRMWLSELAPYAGFSPEGTHRVVTALLDSMQLWMVARLGLGKYHMAPTIANQDRLDGLLQAVARAERVAADNIQSALAERTGSA